MPGAEPAASRLGHARSLLYVPGDRPDLLGKAETAGADVIVADLEDGVAPDRKDDARAAVAAWLREPSATGPTDGPADPERTHHPHRVVRIDGSAPAPDLESMTGHLPDALLVSKASVDRVRTVAAWLAERATRLPPLIGLIESAIGVQEAPALAACGHLVQLAMGEADLAADLHLQPSPDGRELLPHRAAVVVASAAGGLPPPAGPVSTDFTDLDTLRADTLALRRQGFRSRQAIHPAQVAVINEVFTPTAAEVARAADVVARFEQAEARGSGVCVDADGRLIDVAVVRTAREVLARVAYSTGSMTS
ncbi:HpcH/HpaI aldolase/citrate lyase family protein [Euzebya tangerina]|uniref:HpcH/HpaI aldolase/citrate lyase family protein n=1 Tax=Euzebya tangerina TaxID=591198 RepID=UPI00196AB724|nr:CoA ester lyase [Euzebya tangerina]